MLQIALNVLVVVLGVSVCPRRTLRRTALALEAGQPDSERCLVDLWSSRCRSTYGCALRLRDDISGDTMHADLSHRHTETQDTAKNALGSFSVPRTLRGYTSTGSIRMTLLTVRAAAERLGV